MTTPGREPVDSQKWAPYKDELQWAPMRARRSFIFLLFLPPPYEAAGSDTTAAYRHKGENESRRGADEHFSLIFLQTHRKAVIAYSSTSPGM